MGGRGLGRFGVAILLVISTGAPVLAGGAQVFGGVTGLSTESGVRLAAHFRKVQSFFCYPKNYWWFYRPYTTATMNYARCMPYFHYLDEAYPAPRNLRQGQPIK